MFVLAESRVKWGLKANDKENDNTSCYVVMRVFSAFSAKKISRRYAIIKFYFIRYRGGFGY